jgi:hypothetical protein
VQAAEISWPLQYFFRFFFVCNEKLCNTGVRFKTQPGCVIDNGCQQYNIAYVMYGRLKMSIVIFLGIFHAIRYQNDDMQRKLFAES